MTIAGRTSAAILSIASIAAAWYIFLSLPNWQFQTLIFSLTSTSLLLVLARKPVGYSVGQLGLFLMLLVSVARIIGDYETPDPQPLTTSPYLVLGILCAAFIAIAGVLRKAQIEMVKSNGSAA
jgi:hypothetical protein